MRDNRGVPATSLPENPIFVHSSERLVWVELMQHLPSEVTVLCNVKLLVDSKEHEIDFLLLWPNHGIVGLEVKGGKVSPNLDSTFTQEDSTGSRIIDPISQTMSSVHALQRYLDKKHITHFSAKPYLVFPYSEIPVSYSRSDIPREIIADELDLANLVDGISELLRGQNFRPNAHEVAGMITALGRIMESQRDLSELGEEREAKVRLLTETQFNILNLCRDMPRFAILGAAGCGKTFVAIELAIRRAKAGDRVLFLCYNKGLASFLARVFQNVPENERPAVVTNLHALGPKIGFQPEHQNSDTYWDQEAPLNLSRYLSNQPIETKFDTVIIDEAQDFHPLWWDLVTASLKDPEVGRIYAFGDTRQGIFRKSEGIPLSISPLRLETNYRNSLPIAELASICATDEILLSGLDSTPVQFVETEESAAISASDKVVNELISQGWNSGDICVLTTNSKHQRHEKLQSQDKQAYWDSFFEGNDVFYGHVLGFKGLERRVVVLAVNGWKLPDQKKDLLYTAVTRARDLLIICSDRENLRQAGGKEFVKKLTRNA